MSGISCIDVSLQKVGINIMGESPFLSRLLSKQLLLESILERPSNLSSATKINRVHRKTIIERMPWFPLVFSSVQTIFSLSSRTDWEYVQRGAGWIWVSAQARNRSFGLAWSIAQNWWWRPTKTSKSDWCHRHICCIDRWLCCCSVDGIDLCSTTEWDHFTPPYSPCVIVSMVRCTDGNDLPLQWQCSNTAKEWWSMVILWWFGCITYQVQCSVSCHRHSVWNRWWCWHIQSSWSSKEIPMGQWWTQRRLIYIRWHCNVYSHRSTITSA